ncbi:MAG: efflux RND transporter periplasmic adaptor subunit [Candidatus Symbiodolus clandestinus]
MKKWSINLSLLFIVLFGSVIGLNAFKQRMIAKAIQHLPEPSHPVSIQRIELSEWRSVLESVGFLEAYQGVTLANQLPGTVQQILFTAGETVQAGTKLLRLDSAVEQAQLQVAQAKQVAIHTHYQRSQRLYRQRAIAKEQFEQAQADYQTLMAEIKSLQESLCRRQIIAPFTGVLGLNQVQLGQYLTPGTPIVNVQDLSKLRIRFTVPQTAITQIKLQQPITIQVDALPGEQFSGVICALEPRITPHSGLLEVQADVPADNPLLRPGMLARIRIPSPTSSQQQQLPQMAVAFTLYGETAYRLIRDEQFVQRVSQVTLKVGERRDGWVQVLEGLQPGDQVVTAGQVRLSHGSRVTIIEQESVPSTSQPLPKL